MAGKKKKRFKPLLRWLALHIGVPAGYVCIRIVMQTIRIRALGREVSRVKPMLFAVHHGDFIGACMEGRHHVPDVDVLMSRSRDGEILDRLVRMFGAGTIRGGSSSGQLEALREMQRSLSVGRSVVVAVDGPRGPAGVVKPGIVLTAQYSGVPIVPCAVIAERAWHVRSWDRTAIPKPFSRIVMQYGQPIHVPRNASREELERITAGLEVQLRELRKIAPL
ncbi:MAG: lysophospholipid acyltransferase family protein [Candidatus Sumerlaeaceae bacterium]|nr:lysophospholipid acyltransferase family protein [Candidatus Sumerlaeaceae bacterium]